MITMTDKIYYKIQYPLKKAVQSLNRVFLDQEKYEQELEKLDFKDREKLKRFIQEWENGNKEALVNVIEKLKSKYNN